MTVGLKNLFNEKKKYVGCINPVNANAYKESIY